MRGTGARWVRAGRDGGAPVARCTGGNLKGFLRITNWGTVLVEAITSVTGSPRALTLPRVRPGEGEEESKWGRPVPEGGRRSPRSPDAGREGYRRSRDAERGRGAGCPDEDHPHPDPRIPSVLYLSSEGVSPLFGRGTGRVEENRPQDGQGRRGQGWSGDSGREVGSGGAREGTRPTTVAIPPPTYGGGNL